MELLLHHGQVLLIQYHLLGLQLQVPQPLGQARLPHGRHPLQHGQGRPPASLRRQGREISQGDFTALPLASLASRKLCWRNRRYQRRIVLQRWTSPRTSARGGSSSRTSSGRAVHSRRREGGGKQQFCYLLRLYLRVQVGSRPAC